MITLAGILSIFGSSAFGSLLGGLFAWLNRKTDLESKRLDQAHEQAKWGHELAVKDKDIEYAKAEAAARKDVAVVEGEATVEAARMAAIAASQAADKVTSEELQAAGWWRWLLVWAMAFNKMVRPVATVVLTAFAVYINMVIIQELVVVWPKLDQAKQYEMAMQAFAWITGQAAAVLGYWFVARGSGK
jgi:hypothetical protein